MLVIRCGIGLLPMLCVRNGKARKVIALEQSNCIEYARYIIKDNMYSHKITLIQSTVIIFVLYLSFITKALGTLCVCLFSLGIWNIQNLFYKA